MRPQLWKSTYSRIELLLLLGAQTKIYCQEPQNSDQGLDLIAVLQIWYWSNRHWYCVQTAVDATGIDFSAVHFWWHFVEQTRDNTLFCHVEPLYNKIPALFYGLVLNWVPTLVIKLCSHALLPVHNDDLECVWVSPGLSLQLVVYGSIKHVVPVTP